MFRHRLIPVLLLRNKGLVKSKRFKDHKYIGDPLNAVTIFNDLKADELVFLDTLASTENRTIDPSLVKQIGHQANMPFAVGGGINSLKQIQQLLSAGSEKVVINSYAATNPEFILKASEEFGSSTIMVCIDIKKKLWGKQSTWINNGTISTKYDPLHFAKIMEQMGAGEIIIQSIDKDGTMDGYDIPLIDRMSEKINIPVIALGGAGTLQHMSDVLNKTKVNALAGGSFFVYKDSHKGVLINYPDPNELKQLQS